MVEGASQGPLVKLLFAAALLAICVAIHAAGLITLARWFFKSEGNTRLRFSKDLWLMVSGAWGIIFLHALEISIWAVFYTWKGCMPDLSTAYYFSATTYTTVGYGDLVLPVEWRNLSGVEALTGILMAGLSTGFFFMVMNRMFQKHTDLH